MPLMVRTTALRGYSAVGDDHCGEGKRLVAIGRQEVKQLLLLVECNSADCFPLGAGKACKVRRRCCTSSREAASCIDRAAAIADKPSDRTVESIAAVTAKSCPATISPHRKSRGDKAIVECDGEIPPSKDADVGRGKYSERSIEPVIRHRIPRRTVPVRCVGRGQRADSFESSTDEELSLVDSKRSDRAIGRAEHIPRGTIPSSKVGNHLRARFDRNHPRRQALPTGARRLQAPAV